jgi:RNA polymerase sigma factor (sigma-70 family)
VDSDTDLGGPAAAFPLTRASVVQATADRDPAVRREAFGSLVAAYWKPVYKYLRVRRGLDNEAAKDLTQAFFVQAWEKGFLADFQPARARFRTFLRVCLDAFVAKEERAATCLKRGGGVAWLSLDFDTADGELRAHPCAAGQGPDEFLHREWVRELFALALEDFRRDSAAAGKATHFQLFQRYDVDAPERQESLTYDALGKEYGLSVTQVTNYLAWARRRFRQLVLERLRATSADDEEFLDEARRLFGGRLP